MLQQWVSRVKTPWGCRNSFWKGYFSHFSGARANLTRSGRAAVWRLLSELGSLPKMALWLRCGAFSRLFVFCLSRPRFRKLQVVLFTPPSFCLVFLFFVRILLVIGGNAALHACFWAVGLQPFLSFYKNTVSPWQRFFLLISQCFPFVFFFGFVFHNIFCFLCFSFFVVLSLFFPFLSFCFYFLPCFFCFMKRTTSKQYISKVFLSIISVFFGYLFCSVFQIPFFFRFFFFFFVFSVVCFGQHQWFHLSKKTISKTPNCKFGYFSTWLRTKK